MGTFFRVLLLILIPLLIATSCSTSSMQNACTQHEWTHEPRTQGGGYLWFLGVGESEDAKKSMHIAEGEAVYRLMLECKHPHQNARFIERCSERSDGSFKAFARVSQTSSECASASSNNNINSSLEEKGKQYIQANLYKEFICHDQDSTECLKSGIKIIKLDEKKAAQYFYEACNKGNKYACYYYGAGPYRTGEVVSKQFLERSCALGFDNACIHMEKDNGPARSEVISLNQELGMNFYETQKKYAFNLASQKGAADEYCAGSNSCLMLLERVPDLWVANPHLNLQQNTYVAFNPPTQRKGNAFYYFTFHKGKVVSFIMIHQFPNSNLAQLQLNDLQQQLIEKRIKFKNHRGTLGPLNQIIEYSNAATRGSIVLVPQSSTSASTVISEEEVIVID